jgi:hypothetical protein
MKEYDEKQSENDPMIILEKCLQNRIIFICSAKITNNFNHLAYQRNHTTKAPITKILPVKLKFIAQNLF